MAKKKAIWVQVAGISAALHVVALVVFGSLTIYKFVAAPEPEFEPPPPLESIEPQKLEYKVKSKDLQKNSSRPRQQRISVKSISQINTPDIDVALPEFSADVAVGAGTAIGGGFGSGLGSGGLGFGQSAVDFFGVSSRGERIVIVFDVSASVKNRVESSGIKMEVIRDETIRMIEGLNPGTVFGIIQHSRNYDLFKDELVPAVPEEKDEAVKWLREEFVTTGASRPGWTREEPNGIQSVMKAAFELGPDLIFLLSDASYQRSVPNSSGEDVPWDELQRDVHRLQQTLDRPAEINFIGFGVQTEDGADMKRFIRRHDGNYQEFDKSDLRSSDQASIEGSNGSGSGLTGE